MPAMLPRSANANHFADALRRTLAPVAERIAGADGRIDPSDAQRALLRLSGEDRVARDALVALARNPGPAVSVAEFVEAQVERARTAAAQATGSDGRLSRADAAGLPADLQVAFHFFRSGQWEEPAPRVRFSAAVLSAVMQKHGIANRVTLLQRAADLGDGNGYLKRTELERAAVTLVGGFASGLAARVPASWRGALADHTDTLATLDRFIADERQTHEVYPPDSQIFAALESTSLDDVKVVLIGQDPYHGPGQAHGLSFSVKGGARIPPSLRNIFRELESDTGTSAPQSGNLQRWANDGVLLLNTALTVRQDEPASHSKKGWEEVTNALLEAVNAKGAPVVFLLLGAHAQRLGANIDTSKHTIVARSHPSPFSARNNFLGTRPFTAVNDALTAAGRPPVRWELP